MKNRKHLLIVSQMLMVTMAVTVISGKASAQAELAPWGNLSGIRIDGQLMEFETNVSVVKPDWSAVKSTGKEKQRPRYHRNGLQQVVTTSIDSVSITESVEDSAGAATLRVGVKARDNISDDVYLSIAVPDQYFSKGLVQAGSGKPVSLSVGAAQLKKYLSNAVTSLTFTAGRRQVTIRFDGPNKIIPREDTANDRHRLRFYIPVHTGTLSNGDSTEKEFIVRATGPIDKTPVTVALGTTDTGRAFVGFGGNFRLQNPKADPQVIDYCLENLRVAMGRVEMPWRFWQPGKNDNPIDSARNGKLHKAVENAMLMAQRLSKKNIPIILSAWSGPAWAVVGQPKFRPGPDGVWGNPLNEENMQEIYKSITDYILYLKEKYAVEIGYFSFNESDLGINIRQTGEEHARLIKGLGAYFAKAGLQTKMLLGDNSDATTYEFIYPAMNDPEARPFIGAVSFHSWRGWEKETLQKWADAAAKLKLPLIVAEGSIDAQAWGYPAIFEEPVYAREEINLYVRLLSICQPASILQWQLTSDYSPLSGGGVFGNNEQPLHPTQRFWNLKQLASTPEGLRAMSAASDKSLVTVAALGDKTKNLYSVHVVNNGPTRKATVTGLPSSVKSLKIVVTDKDRQMKEGTRISVANGSATFVLDTQTYTTLTSE